MFIRHDDASYVARTIVAYMLSFRPQRRTPSQKVVSGMNWQAHTDLPQGFLTVPSTALRSIWLELESEAPVPGSRRWAQ